MLINLFDTYWTDKFEIHFEPEYYSILLLITLVASILVFPRIWKLRNVYLVWHTLMFMKMYSMAGSTYIFHYYFFLWFLCFYLYCYGGMVVYYRKENGICTDLHWRPHKTYKRNKESHGIALKCITFLIDRFLFDNMISIKRI